VGHTDSVESVAFSPDGKKIVSGSDDDTLRVWDAESGSSILGPLVGHSDWVKLLAFSPDGKKIVSGSNDNTLRRVWDAESGLLFTPHSLPDNDSSSPSMAYSSFLHATISDSGWVMDSYGQVKLWIPAHVRGDPLGAAVHKNHLVWFNPDGMPIIVARFGLSWWSEAGTL
jgi:WD40 repeat protein